ncbi:phosphate butyryltransferase [Planococcus sp. CAU13]|uniref:phosphate butyryltransferase n=1 Tax=Planococcus sp. CAU13 TaxID=1541197 RepID=UPI000A746579|nr:phosphate butyryltransferase [Planococcus sp. CAU13]
MILTTLNELVEQISHEQKQNDVAVAAAADLEVLEAVHMAITRNIARFTLFDEEVKLRQMISEHYPELLNHPKVRLINVKGAVQAANAAVKSVFVKDSNVLMKGHIATAVLLKAVLNEEYGLRTGNILSHVAAFEIQGFDRLIYITDAGMNITPDLKQKAQIIRNAAQIARSVGVEMPVVAPLAAVEVVNPAMPATLDAAALSAMNRRGQIKGCIVDGPLALDNAISTLAAAHKGITGETAGKADILVVPNIEAGNILYKSLVYFAQAKVGGVIAGAKAPIVLTSRADSAESKLYSLALAIKSAATE